MNEIEARTHYQNARSFVSTARIHLEEARRKLAAAEAREELAWGAYLHCIQQRIGELPRGLHDEETGRP